jgi:hypothetical protein
MCFVEENDLVEVKPIENKEMKSSLVHTGIFFAGFSFSFSFSPSAAMFTCCELRAVAVPFWLPFFFPQLLKPHLDLVPVSSLVRSTRVLFELRVLEDASRAWLLGLLVSLSASGSSGLNSQYFRSELYVGFWCKSRQEGVDVFIRTWNNSMRRAMSLVFTVCIFESP